MKNFKVPKTIQNWINKNSDIVEHYFMEDDDYDGYSNPISCWCYLDYGWCVEESGSHILHEATAGEFLDRTKLIKPCCCESVQVLIKVDRWQ